MKPLLISSGPLVSVIALTDLLYASQLIYSNNYKTIPLLLTASLWYLIVTTLLSIGQFYIERYYGRGTARAQPLTPIQRLRRNLFSFRHAEVRLEPEPPPPPPTLPRDH